MNQGKIGDNNIRRDSNDSKACGTTVTLEHKHSICNGNGCNFTRLLS